MPLKSEPLEEPEINLTPMVDCVFLLIIFFLVGTQFEESEAHHEITLPTVTDAQPLTGLPDEIIINVTRDGGILVGREPKTMEELAVTLQQAHDRYADQRVVVRGDEETQYKAIMEVINACERVGLANINLAGRPLPEGPM